jgi:hypothetical protein
MNDPCLVWDNRLALQTQNRPGLHVLLAGVSHYPNLPGPNEPLTDAGLGMRRLSSTSLSAYLLLDWLVRSEQAQQLHVPLATCRLLLTSTPVEMAKAPPLGGPAGPTMTQLGAPSCSLDPLRRAAMKWRDDASAQREAATLFYFAGHGIERSRGDQVILLDSFGDAGGLLLQHAVDVKSLRSGMAPTVARQNIARTQFYFIDACRNLPSVVLTYQQLQASWLFDVVESGTDDRNAPIFFAAPPDGKAQAVPNEQTLFSIALLRCLKGEAAKPPRDDAEVPADRLWHVTSQSLNSGLETTLAELNRQYKGSQRWIADGFGEDVVLCYLNGPPKVPIRIMVEPDPAVPHTQVTVVDAANPAQPLCTFPAPGTAHPYQRDLIAGQYRMQAASPLPNYRPLDRPCVVEPLGSRLWKLKVG